MSHNPHLLLTINPTYKLMKSDLNKTDELTRRQFMANAAKTYLGVGLSPMLGASLAGKAMAQTGGKSQAAEAVIFLNMSGGMSHIDTFDVKPGNKEIQGPVNAIGTSADGIQISQYLPKTAAVMDKICVIRSMSNQNGDHFSWSIYAASKLCASCNDYAPDSGRMGDEG